MTRVEKVLEREMASSKEQILDSLRWIENKTSEIRKLIEKEDCLCSLGELQGLSAKLEAGVGAYERLRRIKEVLSEEENET